MKRLKFKPRAVIFDMDGVIVDSMPYHFLAWYEALRPFGIRVSCFDVYAKEGERWQKTLRGFFRQAKLRPAKETLRKIFFLRQRIFRKYFRRIVFPGAEAFLVYLKRKGYLLGLVTGTPAEEVRDILPERIRNLFDCIVTGDHIKKGKPHPEPYLNAAKKLALEPRQCLVVENAPLGIESAKRAGMFCVALVTSLPREYLRQADVLVNNLEGISGIAGKPFRL